MNTAGPVIRVHYLETEEHFLAAWDRNPRKSKAWILALIALAVVGLVNLPSILREIAKENPGAWMSLVALLLLAAFVIWLLGPGSQRKEVRKSIQKLLTTPPAEAWIEFSDAGFMSTGQGGKSAFYPWTTVSKVLQVADGLLICVDEHAYYWIPQHLFASAEDYGIVTKLAQTKAKLSQTNAD